MEYRSGMTGPTVEKTEKLTTDIVVVGGGLAALSAALEAGNRGLKVLIACKGRIGRGGNTIMAAGVLSACLPDKDNPDTFEEHFTDTLESGQGLCNPDLVRVLVEKAPEAVAFLQAHGVKFKKQDNCFVRGQAPGHSKPRSIFLADQPFPYNVKGQGLTLPLLAAVQKRGILALELAPVIKLLVEDGQIAGVVALDTQHKQRLIIRSKAVVLATGGGGRIFEETNNTREMTGEGYVLGYEAGASLQDLEFVQFYPVMMKNPRLVVSTPLFGEGALLRNRHGKRFMPDYDPEKLEMTTRDIMARAIFREIREGRGSGGNVFLDITTVKPEVLENKYGQFIKQLNSKGINPYSEWLPVSPTTHFFMGGLVINNEGATTIAGLYAAGEAAAGVHGANRLSGNSLTETVVFGREAGKNAAKYAKRIGRCPEMPVEPEEVPASSQDCQLGEIEQAVRRIMWEKVSLVRTAGGLEEAAAGMEAFQQTLSRCAVKSFEDTVSYFRVKSMCILGELVAQSALCRKESRGAHYREDFPSPQEKLVGNILVTSRNGNRCWEFIAL